VSTTQHPAVLAEATGIRYLVDPPGGSYYVERLTAGLLGAATELIDAVEAMINVIEAGMPSPDRGKRRRRRQNRGVRGAGSRLRS
jgi:methylmalonyl-CoA mutase N-terminal domain/subunit